MKKGLFLLTVMALAALTACGGPRSAGKVYPCRWVFASRSLGRDSDVDSLRSLIQVAAAHGLNGLVLTAGLDRLDLNGPDYFRRLDEVKEACRSNKIEIIPVIFSAGYGEAVLAHNPNLCEGLPVRDALFVVRGTRAVHVPDPAPTVVNGGFEVFRGDSVAGFDCRVDNGAAIAPDREIKASGKASLRFDSLDRKEGQAVVSQKIAVRPQHVYRVRLKLRTEGLAPARRFQIEVYGGERKLNYYDPALPADNDWREVVLAFNSWDCDTVRVVLGVPWGRVKGRFWVDDLRVEEVGLTNILRRPGTPLSVRGEASGVLYEEDRDFAPVVDSLLNYTFEHEGPDLVLLPGSRITEGERLRVSWYHGFRSVEQKRQVTICMSEPEVYDIWRIQARLLQEHLGASKFFLDMDEIRAGGTCAACAERGLSMGEILGDCITKQYEILREASPGAEVFIWSDMLDPHHNADTTWGRWYYHVKGLYTGSWEHIPKELTVACWWDEKRDVSLGFFSGLGHRTLAAAYYDAEDLENVKGWLKSLDATAQGAGIMYTTWEDKYALLPAFGDMVTRRTDLQADSAK
ncbi:hypothetical protein LLH00_12450 [bacterium]|nr:hypothetical protein [bacterium]